MPQFDPALALDILIRFMGALYVVGGAFAIWQMRTMLALEGSLAKLERLVAEHDPEAAGAEPGHKTDRVRHLWLMAGGALTLVTGLAMVLGSKLAVLGLCLLIVHQGAYFIRQRRMELRAPDRDSAEDARPARSTLNAFYVSCVLAVLAALLWAQGRLT